jgi:hypothetical protein
VIPLRHEQATITMTAPAGHEAEVRPLHVAIIDGCSASRWGPTPEELTVLNAGGSVELWVMGRQPPVMLTVVPHSDEKDR